MAIYKIGSRLKILITLTDDELNNLQPLAGVTAWAKSKSETHELQVEVSGNEILISGDTEGWSKGIYSCDVRCDVDGEVLFLPSAYYLQFQLIAPVTGEDEQ